MKTLHARHPAPLAIAGVVCLFAGLTGAFLPATGAQAAAVKPAGTRATSEFPDAQSAVQAAVAAADDPDSAHEVFTSGQITIEAFYCSSKTPTQTYTVPDDVTSVYLEAVGGQGQTPNPNQTGLGGLGGQVTGGLTVKPLQQFTVQVGCHGTVTGGASDYAAGGARGTGWSHLNVELTVFSKGYDGGGGGGASAVLSGDTPVAVAGGGGGAAGGAPDCFESRGSSSEGFPFFFYCGGNAVESGGNGGDGGGSDTQGTVGAHNAKGPTPDGSTCGGGKAGAPGKDFDKVGGGGAGGGGGGGYAGGCGGEAGQSPNLDPTHYGTVHGSAGNGGGGGQSYADASLRKADIARSDDAGDGYVLFLTSADGVRTTSFHKKGPHTQTFCVPDGVDELFVDALGAAGGGGGHSFEHVGTGGSGSGVQAVVPVRERTQLQISVGEYGWSSGGWGDGHGGKRGEAESDAAYDGAGGGGSTAVKQSSTPCGHSPLKGLEYLVVAGGGGGGGGNGFLGSGGGDGGAGGNPGEDGETGDSPNGGYGGCGGVAPGKDGCNDSVNGGKATGSTTGGGGGGGGGGYNGGGTGHGTHDGEDGGGGGGGGGASYVTPKSTQKAHYYHGAPGDYNNRDNLNDGKVDLIVPVPAKRSQVEILSGNKQSANPGHRFGSPIKLQYVDALSSAKVAGLPFTVSVVPGKDGPAVSLQSGAAKGTTITVDSDSRGQIVFFATSDTSRDPGQVEVTVARADVEHGLIKPATVTLFNTQYLTTVTLASSDAKSSDGEPVTFTAKVSSASANEQDDQFIQTGTVQFRIDGKPFGKPVPVSDGQAVSDKISTLAPGPHHIGASYTDVDRGVNGPGFGSLAQVVRDRASASVPIVSSDANAVSGDKVIYTATVNPQKDLGAPTGTVQFTLNGKAIGDPVAVGADGRATSPDVTLRIPSGEIGGRQKWPVTAVYSGDDHYRAATGDYTQFVRWSTALDIQSSAPYGDYTGADLRFTGTIEGTWWALEFPAHTGTMQVFLGSKPLTKPFTVHDKIATSPPIPASKLGTGIHEISIHYSGDENYGPAVSDTFYQIVVDFGGDDSGDPSSGGGSASSPGHGSASGTGLAATGSDPLGSAMWAGLFLALGALMSVVAVVRRRLRLRRLGR